MTSSIEVATEHTPEECQKLVGIGGWLVLPAVGLALGPVLGIAGVILAIGRYTDVNAAGHGAVFILELGVLLGFLLYQVYVATRFFGKKRNAPSAIIALLVVSLGINVLLLLLERETGAENSARIAVGRIIRDAVGAALWIPYFKVSGRVKATFVK